MDYRSCYEEAAARLQAEGIREADLDARLLLEWICHTDRNTLLVHGDRPVTEAERSAYEAAIVRRLTREPLQYIIGSQDFMGLSFQVNPHVLIPRQDTEILVEEAMPWVHDGMSLLDLCTGSGCILLSLLQYSNDTKGVGVDLSREALGVAENNAKALGLETRVQFLHSDLLAAVPFGQRFDVVTANPPYIPSEVIETLQPEVRRFEPRMALDGTDDGLHFYRRIALELLPYLYVGSQLFLEIGHDQGIAVSGILEEAGYRHIQVIKDYAGLDRVVHAEKGE